MEAGLTEMTETWFLMFDIAAMDGLGPERFAGRTTDPKIAEAWHKRCQEDFHSGYVVICTDTLYQVWST